MLLYIDFNLLKIFWKEWVHASVLLWKACFWKIWHNQQNISSLYAIPEICVLMESIYHALYLKKSLIWICNKYAIRKWTLLWRNWWIMIEILGYLMPVLTLMEQVKYSIACHNETDWYYHYPVCSFQISVCMEWVLPKILFVLFIYILYNKIWRKEI